MNIGNIIRSRRTELGLTLEEIGAYVGVGKSTVKKWESGYIKNIKRDKIALLAEVLKLSPLTFITGEIESADKKITPGEGQLTEGEKELLDLFNLVPEEQQHMVLEMIRAALRTK